MTRAVPRGPEPFCHGISAKVVMSGIRYWSLSAIRVKPSMEQPSNHVPCRTQSSSRWIGMVTALTWPMMSVNWSWTNRIPSALAVSIFSTPSTGFGHRPPIAPPVEARSSRPDLVPSCTKTWRARRALDDREYTGRPADGRADRASLPASIGQIAQA